MSPTTVWRQRLVDARDTVDKDIAHWQGVITSMKAKMDKLEKENLQRREASAIISRQLGDTP